MITQPGPYQRGQSARGGTAVPQVQLLARAPAQPIAAVDEKEHRSSQVVSRCTPPPKDGLVEKRFAAPTGTTAGSGREDALTNWSNTPITNGRNRVTTLYNVNVHSPMISCPEKQLQNTNQNCVNMRRNVLVKQGTIWR